MIRIKNPWIELECRSRGIQEASLPTFLEPSFSQCQEDVVLEALLRSRLCRRGRPLSSLRYLEIGANHPIQTSNTYLFYARYGARGVLVEANARLLEALGKLRPGDTLVHLAVAPAGTGSVTLHLAEHSELSSVIAGHIGFFGAQGKIIGEVSVPCTTIDALLAEHFPAGCDLLTLDIEGLDLAVLESAKLDCHRPQLLMVEHGREFMPGNDERLIAALAVKHYGLVAESPINLIFADRDRGNA